MINLHESMGPDRDRTRDPWICSQISICSQTRYRLRYAARLMIRLRVLAGWSETLLVAHTTLLEISCHGSNAVYFGIYVTHLVNYDTGTSYQKLYHFLCDLFNYACTPRRRKLQLMHIKLILYIKMFDRNVSRLETNNENNQNPKLTLG